MGGVLCYIYTTKTSVLIIPASTLDIRSGAGCGILDQVRATSSAGYFVDELKTFAVLDSRRRYTHIHTCMHAYTHACIHTSIRPYIHTCNHTYVHAYIHART